MGPLVPDLVSNELNLIVALIVGIAFGFILEQAGFSSSRKLTGLFYGTDFTVLRVFFTAGATAMVGVLLLADLGLLDTGVIFINPTFLYAALLGGIVMGVGFVVGGYCPGTSFCGAAVGRIDAMLFVLGGLVGVFGFGELFPRVQRLYLAGSMGDPTVPAILGVSPGVFALGLIVVAVAAFVVTTRIERYVNPDSTAGAFPVWPHRAAGAALLAFGVVLASTPDYKTRLVAASTRGADSTVARMTADELAFRLLDPDPALVIIDVRPVPAFAKDGLPGAVNIPAADLFGKTWADVLARARTHKVFVANSEADAARAAALASRLGYRQIAVLAGGLDEFARTILRAPAPAAAPADERDDRVVAEFRRDAGIRIAALMKARGAAKPGQRTVKKITGGCGV